MTVPLLPFYNRFGERVELSGYPSSFGQLAPTTRDALLSSVEDLVKCGVSAFKVRSQDASNLVLEAFLSDGRRVNVRQVQLTEDEEENVWRQKKFVTELTFLEWLRRNPTFGVPQLYAVNAQRTLTVSEKQPGDYLINNYGLWSYIVKEKFVASYAELALHLFNLEVPQRIGSSIPSSSSSTKESHLEVGPLIGPQPCKSASQVFDTPEDYFTFLFTSKRARCTESAAATLDKLYSYAQTLLQAVDDKYLRRIAFKHDQLNETNILVGEEGTITGVMDWDMHSFVPAVLAVDYPQWLSYEGCANPRFAVFGQFERFWVESKDESAHLTKLFENIVSARDPDFFKYLKQGALLRDIVRWLVQDDDPECGNLVAWMHTVFS